MASPANITLFVDLLDQYLYFFEKECPVIQDKFVSGLIALIKEHLNTINPLSTLDASAIADAKTHFNGILRHIAKKQQDAETKDRFSPIECG